MLLSLSLVHILPEALEAYETYKKEHEQAHPGHDEHAGEHGFPLVFFLFVIGFLLMLFFDQVLFKKGK